MFSQFCKPSPEIVTVRARSTNSDDVAFQQHFVAQCVARQLQHVMRSPRALYSSPFDAENDVLRGVPTSQSGAYALANLHTKNKIYFVYFIFMGEITYHADEIARKGKVLYKSMYLFFVYGLLHRTLLSIKIRPISVRNVLTSCPVLTSIIFRAISIYYFAGATTQAYRLGRHSIQKCWDKYKTKDISTGHKFSSIYISVKSCESELMGD